MFVTMTPSLIHQSTNPHPILPKVFSLSIAFVYILSRLIMYREICCSMLLILREMHTWKKRGKYWSGKEWNEGRVGTVQGYFL